MAPSRTAAQLAIEEGIVLVNGVVATRAATMVGPDAPVAITRDVRRFVSRGGDKLDGALDALHVDVAGRRWLDAGASTGGFTDCLLQRGAEAVIALDVGYGQLDWGLRNDERVTVMERVNVREIEAEQLPWLADAVVADLSFISLRTVLPSLVRASDPAADLILLVKPQFEVGKERIGKGGVVRDPELWDEAIRDVAAAGERVGLGLVGVAPSEVPGPAGNREFFLWLRRGAAASPQVIGAAVALVSGR
jgi:23S rRNA (cytidine1920-2'-O)/16S rRNA (cytidine1409-2'-O)-methyltransferase